MQMFDSGSKAAYAYFEARGTDKMAWLNASRLLNSTWNDVTDYTSTENTTISVAGIER